MTVRKTLIGKLHVDDIFHARAPNGASLICLVLSVDERTIQARRVTTQENVEFDRRTGVATGAVPSMIDSIAPLPPEIYSVFLQMDKKNKELMALDEETRFKDLERLKLTDAEKKALGFVHSHYASNPLPPLP